ncbi:MAG TPA: hypothetical protein VGN01_11955 [Acidobacteriaceae bacterium]|jgi:hypothetical protein
MLKVMVALVGMAFVTVSGLAQKVPDAASPIAACGEAATTFSVSRGPVGDNATAAPEDKATVYIVEVYNLKDKGRFNRPTLRQGLDGTWLGATQGFTYVSASVAPGVHHLCSRWQSMFGSLSQQISLNSFDAVAGRKYYFRVQINVEGASGDAAGPASIDLQQVSEDEGRFLVSEAAVAVSKPKN